MIDDHARWRGTDRGTTAALRTRLNGHARSLRIVWDGPAPGQNRLVTGADYCFGRPHGSFDYLGADSPVMSVCCWALQGAHLSRDRLAQEDRCPLSSKYHRLALRERLGKPAPRKGGAAQRHLRGCVAAVRVISRLPRGLSSAAGGAVRMNPPWPRRIAGTSIHPRSQGA